MLKPCALLLPILLAPVLARAEVPDGIPRSLARERAANVSDPSYTLHYSLAPKAKTAPAEETLHFRLRHADAPLLLDFRDGQLSSLKVNGKDAPTAIDHGHLVLPQALLRTGENTVEASFTANIAAAGKALTRYEDRDDGAEYVYTLFVPMDASMAFPCFDQPDLKGRFRLSVDAPADWTVVSNTAADKQAAKDGQARTAFAETRPISTYLFAFAAGPFVRVHDAPGLPGLYARRSKAKEAAAQAPDVQQTAAGGIRFLADYFAQPFPFPKYDMVLIPSFAFGGMEHAGATFLREESVLFRSAPMKTDLLSRDILVLHELSHQWFGDLVTMRWFDDLWLKEGFAQYMAYQALAALKPQEPAWPYFYASIKPAAYAIDQTQGTTPIYQDIPNLADAKSAYGSIVYDKAPGVLKQLAFVLGEDFRKGLQRYLAEHAYGNAEWADLIGAFEQASGSSLHDWADAWIRRRGMPEVDASWACAGGKLASLSLTQRDVLGSDALWPIATRVQLGYADGSSRSLRAELATRSAPVAGAVGLACPAYVFANDGDDAYGLFLLDPRSRDYVTAHPQRFPDAFRRLLLWGSLWQSVRTAGYDPRRYLDLAIDRLPQERDPLLVRDLLGTTATAIQNYLGERSRETLAGRLQKLAAQRMLADPDQDLRIAWFRALPGIATQPAGRDLLRALLQGQASIPGVGLRQQDRWRLVAALLAYGDPQADAMLAAEQRRDPSGFGKQYAYVAQAAKPEAGNKRWYFDDYLHNGERPEDWIVASLGAFNYWNQSGLTAPYLQPALAELGRIKQQRTIFFMLRWLEAFVGGQHSAEAQRQVHAYLDGARLAPDLRLKILEIVDPLDRTVAIRRRFPSD